MGQTSYSSVTSPQVAKTYRFLTLSEFLRLFHSRKPVPLHDCTFCKLKPVCANFIVDANYGGFLLCSPQGDLYETEKRPLNLKTYIWLARQGGGERRMSKSVKMKNDHSGNLIDPLRIGLTQAQYDFLCRQEE